MTERTFEIQTEDDTVTSIEEVIIVLNEPKSYMDTSTHTLNTIDLKLDQFNAAHVILLEKLKWWEDLRVQILVEAEKVKLLV